MFTIYIPDYISLNNELHPDTLNETSTRKSSQKSINPLENPSVAACYYSFYENYWKYLARADVANNKMLAIPLLCNFDFDKLVFNQELHGALSRDESRAQRYQTLLISLQAYMESLNEVTSNHAFPKDRLTLMAENIGHVMQLSYHRKTVIMQEILTSTPFDKDPDRENSINYSPFLFAGNNVCDLNYKPEPESDIGFSLQEFLDSIDNEKKQLSI